MRNRFITLSLSALLAVGAAPLALGQIPTINFVNTGVGNWNEAANWLSTPENIVIVPGDNFPREVANISNGGTAFLSAPAPFEVDGVLIGDGAGTTGTLEIRAGGSLELADADPVEIAGDGSMYVGGDGTGTLLLSGGTLNAANLYVAGQAGSRMTISGASHVNLSGNAILGRNTRVEGSTADINVGGSLWSFGNLEAKITGATHSAIKVPNGSANLAGTLSVDVSSVNPQFGNSWTLIDAQTVIGEFSSANVVGGELPRGLVVATQVDAAAGKVNAVIDNRLILKVDRGTGAATIENVIGAPIAIDGYTIASPLGSLLTANGTWSSLDDQNVGSFAEAAPTANFISELASTGSLSIAVGGTRALGNPYEFVPTAFGQSGDDLTFQYTTPSGEVENGIVEYSGPVNNLALTVNPDSGAGVVQNQSPFTIAIDGYQISSASGSLSVSGWNSLDDQNVLTWAEANPEAVALAELLPVGGFTLAPNASFNLGDLFVTTGTQDLRLDFTLTDGTLMQGVVVYGSATTGPIGDTNGDGKVNLDDLNNVRNNFGSTGLGDTDGDNDIDLDDLNNVRNNFGAGGSAAVPEPSTIVLAAAGLIAFAGVRARRRK